MVDTEGGCGEKRTRTMEPKTEDREPRTESREPRRRNEEAFKRDCVVLLEKSGKSLKAFAAEMGVSLWNLRDWRRLYRTPAPPRSAEAAEGSCCCAKSRACGRRGTLKKALGIFAEPRPNVTCV